ncbi:MAG: DarT ssDNA thymidine ADP-ribosyltransferase family protein [Rhodobacteraceae bacterium]|nr:DarT ssDNA thymidine ADP-ribosyltransferase family protein [Paracoccaceae bacterium]
MSLKPDAVAIGAFMEGLAKKLKLDPNHSWWPKLLFRSDHVENTAKILNSGALLSRAAAKGLIIKDSASPDYLEKLGPWQRNFVRLYFRPRTPTQFRNEGIRPSNKIWKEAHMPVPVYLLFSSKLLQEQGVQFSLGRLEEKSQLGESCSFLSKMDFKAIYHDDSVGNLGDQGRSSILFARLSEVLVKGSLPFDHLKLIVCRSDPERDTLIALLDPVVRKRWISKIIVDKEHRRLFFKQATFTNSTYVTEQEVRISFYNNIDQAMRGPFSLRIDWVSQNVRRSNDCDNFMVESNPVVFRVPTHVKSEKYCIRITLNGDTAYIGKYDERSTEIF